MARTPQSNIYLYENVPLSNDYQHSIYIPADTTLHSILVNSGRNIYVGTNYSFIREGVVRIYVRNDSQLVNVEALKNCNYMSYTNGITGFVHYCFIFSATYINEGCLELTFEDDYIQTYVFHNKDLTNFRLLPSYILRNHTSDDNIGNNIMPEPVELGEYRINKEIASKDLNDWGYVLTATQNADSTVKILPSLKNNVLTTLRIASGSNLEDFSYIFDEYDGIREAIVSIYMCPNWILDNETDVSCAYETITVTPDYTSIDGYTPRNNKLYTYPYYFLSVTNNMDSDAEYRFERFRDQPNNLSFQIIGTSFPYPEVHAHPVQYNGYPFDYEDGVQMGNFPQVAFSESAFSRMYQQNKVSYYLSAVSTGLNIGSSIAGSIAGGAGAGGEGAGNLTAGQQGVNIASGITNGLGSVGNVFDTFYNKPAHGFGTASFDGLNAGAGLFKYSFYNKSIDHAHAEMIDDYFSYYGYAINKSQIPQLNNRPEHTYIQTKDLNLRGKIPVIAINSIKSIFNAGLNFWNNIENVGLFQLNNKPE